MLYIVQTHIALDGVGRAQVSCSPLSYNCTTRYEILEDPIFRQKNFTHGERELPRRGGISELSSTTRIDAVQHCISELPSTISCVQHHILDCTKRTDYICYDFTSEFPSNDCFDSETYNRAKK